MVPCSTDYLVTTMKFAQRYFALCCLFSSATLTFQRKSLGMSRFSILLPTESQWCWRELGCWEEGHGEEGREGDEDTGKFQSLSKPIVVSPHMYQTSIESSRFASTFQSHLL